MQLHIHFKSAFLSQGVHEVHMIRRTSRSIEVYEGQIFCKDTILKGGFNKKFDFTKQDNNMGATLLSIVIS